MAAEVSNQNVFRDRASQQNRVRRVVVTTDPGGAADGDLGAAEQRRVLVTGGAGFIGSHVIDALLRKGAAVTVVDDLSTGSLANLPDDPRVRFVRGDVNDPQVLTEAFPGCTQVVHLAAIASVQRSVEDPIGTHRTNYEATLRLLEMAHRHGVGRFVYASSAAVYGDAQTPPVDELGPIDPRTPYAIDKLMGEKALAFYRREYGLQAVALRFFNVYGPRQQADSPYSGVISLFVRRLRSGMPVTVFGDGEQTRDFVYVGDVARVVTEMTLRPTRPELPVMNVGRGQAVSVMQLLAAIEDALGGRLTHELAGPRVGEVRHSQAGVERLFRELGWVPATPLVDGLRRYTD